ncbi:MAG: tryptophan-rich sensory protein [Anaerotignum sp.]|nr:tryptophan-rich sensory protein [Anaerotignum sp.]
MTLKKYKPYLISIAIPLAVGGISAFFTMKGMPYFQMQEKPWFQPPNAAFPMVWTILYSLMGISAARIWQSNDPKKTQALRTYGLQLAVNFLWSVIFFGLHNYFLGFLWLLLLIGLVGKMILQFAQIDKKAAKLQIPYLLWCSFAAILNFSIWWLNR